MTIAVGERIPDSILTVMTDDGPNPLTTKDYFGGRRVVLFSVPGAFTPTCSARHLPGFIEKAADFREKGIDAIGCTAVNDVFVMNAWGKSAGADDVDMLSDGNGDFVKSLGLELDATSFGMGHRGQRFAFVADNGVITDLFIEAAGEFNVSSAEHVLGSI